MNKIQVNTLNAGFEWIGGIPENWQRRIIKRDFEVVLGKMLQSNRENEAETEEFYLRSANIKWGGVDTSDINTMWFSPEEKERLRLQYGDLLVSEGGDAGRTSIWRNELESCYFQNAINRIRARQDDSTIYLFYWLYLLKSIGCIDAVVSRITIAHLTAEKLDRIVFLKPPKIEQRRIAAYLDKTCAAIDRAIEKKQKQLETLDALRKSIIHKAVTRGIDDSIELKDSGVEYLGRIPKHWTVDRLKDIANLRNTKTDESSEAEDYLELEDIEQGTGKIISKRNTLEVESAVTLFKKGDVLFGKLRPYLEKYYLAEFDGKCTGEILAFEPLRIQGRFLLYCFASPWFIGQCNMLAYGAKMPRVNWPTQLAKINIPLPSKKEQHSIADYLDAKCIGIESLKQNITEQIATLEQYRKSLIHECVTGKRRITEAYLKETEAHV